MTTRSPEYSVPKGLVREIGWKPGDQILVFTANDKLFVTERLKNLPPTAPYKEVRKIHIRSDGRIRLGQGMLQYLKGSGGIKTQSVRGVLEVEKIEEKIKPVKYIKPVKKTEPKIDLIAQRQAFIESNRQKHLDIYFEPFCKRLLRITEDCRDDMHEPDEQGVDARVIGRVFDNAGLENELTLIIESKGGQQDQFNLATLVALARIEAERRISSK